MPCAICGQSPCSFQCPDSPMYYSAEQERHDDAFYGLDDNHERYAATIESHHDECPPWPGAGGTIRLLYPPPAWDTMDIPF